MAEPVTVEMVRLSARIDADVEPDVLINGWIASARRWVERRTGHLLVPQEVTERFDGFARALQLRAWPIAPDAAVTVNYTDAAGVQQPFTGYRLDVDDRPAVLTSVLGQTLPSTVRGRGSVSVTLQAGYATPAAVPDDMRTAILLLVQSLIDHRTITSDAEAGAGLWVDDYHMWTV